MNVRLATDSRDFESDDVAMLSFVFIFAQGVRSVSLSLAMGLYLLLSPKPCHPSKVRPSLVRSQLIADDPRYNN